jgi:hypothetical protein
MKRKPTTRAESELRERFENAHQESLNPKHYRQIRREIKKEMTELERKMNKKQTIKALKDYYEGDENA